MWTVVCLPDGVNSIVSSYPAYAYLLCIAAGVLYAGGMYYRERLACALSPALRAALATMRFTVVAIIAMLLLGPLIRSYDVRIEQPIVVIAADNSSSLALGADSAEVRTAYPAMLRALEERLGEKYQVARYTFGESTREGNVLDLQEPVTDMAEMLQSVRNLYTNRNLGALIVAGDGVYNRGANPRYATGGLRSPIYTIAMGDTALKRDARIAEVAMNRIAFMGNKFPIETLLTAEKLTGQRMRYTISRQGTVLHSEEVAVSNPRFSHTSRVLLDADKPGIHQYLLSIAPLSGEATLVNNSRTVFIEVIDSRQRVLILANSPHPDVNALRQAISSNENYRVEAATLDDWEGDPNTYNLIVLHQVPSLSAKSEGLRTRILQSDVPVLAVVGAQSDLGMLPRTGLGVDLTGYRDAFNDVGGVVNANFTAFRIAPEFNNLLREAPPLRIPFGTWRVANAAETILNQRIGSIASSDPLLVVNRAGERKMATLLGEGLWRWRMYDYAVAGSHARFDNFVSSLVQFLSLKADKRKFKVIYSNSFMENERVVILAELYNDAYEPVNDVEVTIDIRNEEGTQYPFNMSRTATGYRLDAGLFPVGTYTFTARTQRGGETLEERGSFVVKQFALEAASTAANHDLLFNLAATTGGAMYYPDEAVDALANLLLLEKPLKATSYTTETMSPVLNLKWLFFLLLLLLGTEWLLRKRAGIY